MKKPVDPAVGPARDASTDASTHPWRAPVVVAQIPEAGLAIDIDASAAQRKAMAETAGLRDIASAHGSFELTLERGGRVHVAGRLQARVGQTCVVTLDPIENDIDEAIDLIFVPPEQVKQLSDLVDAAEGDDADVPEPPEDGVKRLCRGRDAVLSRPGSGVARVSPSVAGGRQGVAHGSQGIRFPGHSCRKRFV
jgi:hypothetical protein